MADYKIRGEQIDVSTLRETLRDVLDSVIETGQRRVVTRHGKSVAAVVPLGDLQNLERYEKMVSKALDAARRHDAPPTKALSVEEAIQQFGAVETIAGEPYSRATPVNWVREQDQVVVADEQLHREQQLQQVELYLQKVGAETSNPSILSLRDALSIMLAIMRGSTDSPGPQQPAKPPTRPQSGPQSTFRNVVIQGKT